MLIVTSNQPAGARTFFKGTKVKIVKIYDSRTYIAERINKTLDDINTWYISDNYLTYTDYNDIEFYTPTKER